jgi:hypothetical protein
MARWLASKSAYSVAMSVAYDHDSDASAWKPCGPNNREDIMRYFTPTVLVAGWGDRTAESWAVSSAVWWDGRSASTWATVSDPELSTAWKSVDWSVD